MSRTIRLILATASLAAVAIPVSASAEPIVRPFCQLRQGDPIATTSSDFPVQFTVYSYYWVC